MAAVASSMLSPLARALVQQGRLVQADANAIQSEAKKAGVTYIGQLVQSKKVSAIDVASFASATFGVPSLDLHGVDVEQLPTTLIDTKLIGSQRVIPLHKRGNRLYVATSDPTNEESFSALKFATGFTVEPIVVEEDKLEVLLKRCADSGSKGLSKIPNEALLRAGLNSGELIRRSLSYEPVACDICKNSGENGLASIGRFMSVSEDMTRTTMKNGTSIEILDQAQRQFESVLRISDLKKVIAQPSPTEEVECVTNE